MTLQEAVAKRDALLATLGLKLTRKGDREVQYPTGDDRLKELAALDGIINSLTTQANGSAPPRCTYTTYSRD